MSGSRRAAVTYTATIWRLSLARAESVGHYLIEKLHLPPAKLELKGMGEKMPVADNRTEEGRMLNRRVEIKLLTEKVVNMICHHLVKEKSGIQKAEIKGSPNPNIGQEEKDEQEAVDTAEKKRWDSGERGNHQPLRRRCLGPADPLPSGFA